MMQRQQRLGFVLVYAGGVVGVGRGQGRPEGEKGPRGGGFLVSGWGQAVWVAGREGVADFGVEEGVLRARCRGWCAGGLV